MKSETSLAKSISYLFHPLLMPTNGMLILLFLHAKLNFFLLLQTKLILLAMTFVFTAVLPAMNIFLLVKTKYLHSIYAETRQERGLAYIVTLIFYLSEFYLLQRIEMFHALQLFILGASISIVLAFIINLFSKVSAHAAGIGGIAGMAIALLPIIDMNFLIIPLLFLISGLVGFSRLHLNAHSPNEVYSGFLLGFASEYILLITNLY